MYLSSCRCASLHFRLLSLLALPYGHGSPIRDDLELQQRQRVDCYDTSSAFSNSCSDILGLGGYLDYPVTGWNKTVPICSGWDLDSKCCIAMEPWTTCYLRLAHNISGSDCSQINAQTCSYDISMAVDPSIAPDVAYTMENIYAINNLFTTWYNALQYASNRALTIVQDVILKIDLETQSNFILRDILFAFAVGLA